MWEAIKAYLSKPKYPDLRDEVAVLHRRLNEYGTRIDMLLKLKPPTADEMSVELLRKTIGIVPVEELEPEKRDKLVGQLGPVADILIEKLDRMVRRQERFGIVESGDWAHVMFGRGTINGYELLKDELEKIRGEWATQRQQPESFSAHDITPSP